MTTSRIFSADGTEFVTQTVAQRRRKRTLAIIGAIVASPFILAALAGIIMGMTQGLDTAPPVPSKVAKAQRACEDAPQEAQGNCIGLYLRPAFTLTQRDGTKIATPAGPIQVAECLTQGLDNDEVIACLKQPIS